MMAGRRRHDDARGQAATEVVGVSGLCLLQGLLRR
jgi:hypothetical protein